MNKREIKKVALDYCAGVLQASIGCDYPDEIGEDEGHRFEEAIADIANDLVRRLARYK